MINCKQIAINYRARLDYLFDLHNSVNVAYHIIARVTEVVDSCNIVRLVQVTYDE